MKYVLGPFRSSTAHSSSLARVSGVFSPPRYFRRNLAAHQWLDALSRDNVLFLENKCEKQPGLP
eukprot:834461-Pleurochrysis_carterae.AAC.1